MHINPTVVILDGGATSLAQKIARAVRALGNFSLITPAGDADKIAALKPDALILVSGPLKPAAAFADKIDLRLDGEIFPADRPRLDNPKLYWGKADLSEDFVAGLAAFLKSKNFPATFTPEKALPILIEETRALAGDGKVLLALSGGVDSTVCAALIHRAIGGRLHSMFVDHGLIRAGEADELKALSAKFGDFKLDLVDARQRFLSALAGVSDPEQKRKIIGRVFIEVFEEEAARHKDMSFLGQGTIYPDIIESVSSAGGGAPVKSHHNVGGLPERLNLKLLEPMKYFFKDELRAIGLELGLPKSLVFRQPFPGPGLGVRCVGELTAEKLELLRAADLIVRQEIEGAGLEHKPWQYFAILLPVKSVGVRAHARSMGYACVVRAIETMDAMTAAPSDLPFALLRRIEGRIMSEQPGIARVMYDLSTKPSATIEWE